MLYEWDEKKRIENLKKHRLDFVDADLVYESPLKMTVDSLKASEDRKKILLRQAKHCLCLRWCMLNAAMLFGE